MKSYHKHPVHLTWPFQTSAPFHISKNSLLGRNVWPIPKSSLQTRTKALAKKKSKHWITVAQFYIFTRKLCKEIKKIDIKMFVFSYFSSHGSVSFCLSLPFFNLLFLFSSVSFISHQYNHIYKKKSINYIYFHFWYVNIKNVSQVICLL